MWDKINKIQAEKLYILGKTIYVLPCRVTLDNPWIKPYEIHQDHVGDNSFDKVINNYMYYNCNSELGNYCSFYIKN